MQHALLDWMLLAGSPLLEDLARPDRAAGWLRTREINNARRYGVEQLSRTLVEMGVLRKPPFQAQPSREDWLARSHAGELGVPEVWLEWVRRWFQTSTLAPPGRQATYYMLIKAGRWMRAITRLCDPRAWTRERAASWVAAVDQLVVGEFSQGAEHRPTCAPSRRSQLSPRTKGARVGRCAGSSATCRSGSGSSGGSIPAARSRCHGRSGR